MSTVSSGWIRVTGLFLAVACNGEKKPDAPVVSPPSEKPVATQAPPEPSAPPPVATAPPDPPLAACNSVDTRATTKRDLKRRENKIVGGKPSTAGTWPYAVALATDRDGKLDQYCGGSLIGKKWVLTAAHCQVNPGEKAIVGRRDLTKTDGDVVPIARVKNHAAYDADTNDNDIAVLELTREVTLETVALAAPDLTGDRSTIIGWGYVKEGGPPSSQLREVEVPLVSNDACREGYASDNVGITDNMLCAGLGQGGKDSCQGDSGGPLLMKSSTGKWLQAGVVSFGIGCARPKKYGVYTRVARYVPWVEACTKD